MQDRKEGIKNFIQSFVSHDELRDHEMIANFLTLRTPLKFDNFKIDLEKKIAERHYVIDNQRSIILYPSLN